ncbi:tetratricopeptide repeat protein [Candidatus Pelagibacter bacterium nBUS_33]|uniref:tetratricopeptide repeat protein n=1 Tax=Candidatus Pelagibacter bacterium nBUS_33 TaxID=3374193 RepID=UPI003EB6FD31
MSIKESLKIKEKLMLTSFQNKDYEKAKDIALSMTEQFPNYNLSWKILSSIYLLKDEVNNALTSSKKAITVDPKDADAHNNLGLIYHKLSNYNDALISCRKALEFKPKNAEGYFNVTVILGKLNRFDAAVVEFRKAIKLKPNFVEAYSYLGLMLHKLNRLDEAMVNYKKALDLNSKYIPANRNLNILLKEFKLLDIIKNKRKLKSPLIKDLYKTSLKVENDLVKNLYEINTKSLDDIDPGTLRYGNGRSSEYDLFETNNLIIKNLEKNLSTMIKKTIGSDIFIMESFFNIFKTGSGIVKHNHAGTFDEKNKLINNKYSLVYYLSVGDQSSKQPGVLKFYEPEDEILPIDGMILIFPADRYHASVYSGQKDRVMIGVNFYTIN